MWVTGVQLSMDILQVKPKDHLIVSTENDFFFFLEKNLWLFFFLSSFILFLVKKPFSFLFVIYNDGDS